MERPSSVLLKMEKEESNMCPLPAYLPASYLQYLAGAFLVGYLQSRLHIAQQRLASVMQLPG